MMTFQIPGNILANWVSNFQGRLCTIELDQVTKDKKLYSPDSAMLMTIWNGALFFYILKAYFLPQDFSNNPPALFFLS